MRAILTYHSIDDSGSPVSVDARRFDAHVRFLASGRVRVVPLGTLVSMPDDADAVALTFDDAFCNFEVDALPRLRDHSLPATVFAVTDHIGRRNDWQGTSHAGIPELPLMGWDALARIARQGIDVGAHTRRHSDLTRLTGDELADEVIGSAERIGSELGALPSAFAYPYGRTNPAVTATVRKTFELACTTELRFLAANEERALLPRLDAYYLRGTGQLEAWGTAAFRGRLWVRAQGRRVRQLMGNAGAHR